MNPHSRILTLPLLGRVALVTDPGGAADHFPGGISFHTNLKAQVIRNGKPLPIKHHRNLNWFQRMHEGEKTILDLGSGLVTNVGVLALASDFQIAGVATNPVNLFKLMNWHGSGTGATAAATTDIKLQTAGSTPAPVAGTQTLVSAANLQKYQTVATIPYVSTLAITEWGLLTDSAYSASTGSPFTAGSATTGTSTGTSLTASSATAQGHQQHIAENTASATPHWGLVTSNTTSVFTVPAWYKVSDGAAAGTTPANTEAYLIRPVLWDHKVFSAINVVSGDSIAFTYVLTVTSGG